MSPNLSSAAVLIVALRVKNQGRGSRRLTCFSPPVIFTDRSKVVLLMWILFAFYVVFIILSCLFLVAVWSPAWKWLTSWLSCV